MKNVFLYIENESLILCFFNRPDIWFDDVDLDDIEAALGSEAADVVRKRNGILKSDPDSTEKALVKEHAFEG